MRSITFNWVDVSNLAESIAEKVSESEFNPTLIIGVLRGGCVPALILSHKLGVRRMYMVNCSTTENDSIQAPRLSPTIEGVNSLLINSEDRVLIVDDVINTGSTIRAITSAIDEHSLCSHYLSACLLWDTVNPNDLESEVPLKHCAADIIGDSVHAWVVFPWECN